MKTVTNFQRYLVVAIAEGRQAALRGHNPGYNPFPWQDQQRLHEAWNRGWLEGRSEEIKAHRYIHSMPITVH